MHTAMVGHVVAAKLATEYALIPRFAVHLMVTVVHPVNIVGANRLQLPRCQPNLPFCFQRIHQ